MGGKRWGKDQAWWEAHKPRAIRKRHPGRRRPRKEAAFLEVYRQCGILTVASRLSGLSLASHYRWVHNRPAYATRFNAAHDEACETLEAEARRRAAVGWDEPVFGKLSGKDTGSGQIGAIRKYSDQLLMFLLKGLRPEKYRERFEAHVDGQVTLLSLLTEIHAARQASTPVAALPAANDTEGPA